MIPARRYPAVMILFHWAIALGMVAMVAMGWSMSDWIEDKSLQFTVYQWHKSLGVILLGLVTLRLLARVSLRHPPLPESFPPREKLAATLGHWGLYVLMFALPLTGWLMVSASVYGLPTVVFGWFTWPHIPGVAGNGAVEGFAHEAHELLVWGLIVLVAGHVAAVAKHYFMDGENLLRRMCWTRGMNERVDV